MSNEHIIDDEPEGEITDTAEWVMPKPVFRSSEGHTPKRAPETDFSDDMPTEIANKDDSAFAKPVPASEADTAEIETDTDDDKAGAPAAPKTSTVTPKAAEPSKKGGCAKSFLFIVSMIGLAVAGIIIALIYFLFYYRPAETGTF